MMSPSSDDRVLPRTHSATEKLPNCDPYAAHPAATTLKITKEEFARARAMRQALLDAQRREQHRDD
ncbi:hypothetical protein PPSIR1_24459 [Plesiocystis pacifica SIR-1]|uniref:Uncharacterized protein n=1 Tax=Plesiocystis pacifica SIR-1 TaxID=391625 RepID=A6GGU8_9BACT|nr:hypothetical protein [Plesiocystis pacifica]EDM74889.1 hypothetical protein PPSIR1_24459 [Plesiocystis pacifica SIR-1]